MVFNRVTTRRFTQRLHHLKTLLKAFDDNRRRAAAAVADSRATPTQILLLKEVEEGHYNAGTRAAERVTKWDGATRNVDLLHGNAH